MRGAQSILYQMTGADPMVLTLSAMTLALVGLGAGFIPAHRASHVDPMQALRHE
jgi:ABC-type lipoprotein release transport system permease subunit